MSLDPFDYRSLLALAFAKCKKRNKAFSHRFLALHTGTALGLFQKILSGRAALSPEMAAKFGMVLHLDAIDTELVLSMIALEREKDEVERQKVRQQILALWGNKALKLSAEENAFYGDWKLSLVREMVEIADSMDSLESLLERLSFPIDFQELKKALEQLEELGLIHRVKDFWARSQDHLRSDAPSSESLRALNARWMQLATLAMYGMDVQDRDIASVTVSVSQEGLERIREVLIATRREIAAIARSDENVDRVWQVNLQAFPLLKGP